MLGLTRRAKQVTSAIGAALAMAPALAVPAIAATQELALSPPGTAIGLRAYALGMVPIDGVFTRFRGLLTAADADRCTVDLTIEAASLSMADPAIRDDVISPSFLDAAAFPTLAYRGGCAAGSIRGVLTMHGQTHPLELTLERDRAGLVATGVIRRAEWGMTERPIMVGPTVRIRVSAPWPTHWSPHPSDP